MIAVLSTDNCLLYQMVTQKAAAATYRIGPVTAYGATVNAKEVLFADIGMTKAAIAMAMGYLLSEHPITDVIHIGNMASLCRCNAEIGDIGIGSNALQYDVNFTALGYPMAMIPGVEQTVFDSNFALIRTAKEAVSILQYDAEVGRIISGDRFIVCERDAAALRQEFVAEFLDSEYGAVCEVASAANIPVVAVKGVSHYANDRAAWHYREYRETANQMAFDVAWQMVNLLTAP